MRENRTYGSEGGEANAFPTPIGGLKLQERTNSGFDANQR